MSTLRSDHDKASDWGIHEHVTDSAKSHAQQLVEEVGSVDLAKHAVDVAGEAGKNSVEPVETIDESDRQRNFCHSLGFESFKELKRRSTSASSNDGKDWFETELNDHSWVVWNEDALQADRHFASREEALASVPHDDELTGSSLLG